MSFIHLTGLYHFCTDNLQCDVGLICAKDNSTKPSTSFSKTFMSSKEVSNKTRVCVCDEELGYILEGDHCNSATTKFLSGLLLPLLVLLYFRPSLQMDRLVSQMREWKGCKKCYIVFHRLRLELHFHCCEQ